MAPEPARRVGGIARLEAHLRDASPVFRDAVGQARAGFGDRWDLMAEEVIAHVLPSDDALAAAADGYVRFAIELMRLQGRFDRDGRYPARSQAEVERDVYHDDEYMRTRYLPGLLLSHLLWRHHFRQVVWFEDTFGTALAAAGRTTFADIGTGTGMYSRLALAGAPEATGLGYELSPSSRAYTLSHVAAFGYGDRYSVELRDVVADPPPSVDWLICVEVLEHLDDPRAFLGSLRRLLRPGGTAFITAALNAPHRDHIYLYRRPDEVRQQLEDAGFAVDRYLGGVAGSPSRPGDSVAEVVAFVVT